MQGVEVHGLSRDGGLAFDLREMLACLGSQIVEREWACAYTDARGEFYQAFEQWAASKEWRPAKNLIEAAAGTWQTVDGDFYGRRPGEEAASLVLVAFDSSYWEVFGDEACLALIRAGFDDVRPVRMSWEQRGYSWPPVISSGGADPL